MQKEVFLAECLARNAQFRNDLLTFRRRFPVVLDTRLLSSDRREGFLSPLSSVPNLEIREISPAYLSIAPKKLVGKPGNLSLGDWLVHWLSRPGGLVAPHAETALVAPSSNLEEYCSVLGVELSNYRDEQTRLKRLWPKVSISVWEPALGLWEIRRRSLIPWDPALEQAFPRRPSENQQPSSIAYHPPDSLNELARKFVEMYEQEPEWFKRVREILLSESIEHLLSEVVTPILEQFRSAKLYVPIYQDTRAKDLDWKMIAGAQAVFYGKKHRSRPGQDGGYYRQLLEVWDRREKGQDFPGIARALGAKAISTVRSQYRIANLFITGQSDAGGKARATRQLSDLTDQMNSCPSCTPSKPCPKHYRDVNRILRSTRMSRTAK